MDNPLAPSPGVTNEPLGEGGNCQSPLTMPTIRTIHTNSYKEATRVYPIFETEWKV